MKSPRKSRRSHYDKLAEVLGTSLFMESSFDFIHVANKGVHASTINNFRSYFNIATDNMAQLLDISQPTLYRWVKGNKKLERNTAILLLEIADLFLYGAELFGSKDNFLKWLKLPNSAIGGLEPGHLTEIPGGVSKIRDLLGRIEHGVFS